MKLKKQNQGVAFPDPPPYPRFSKAIVIDSSTTEFEITSTILRACYVAREIEAVKDARSFINKLHNVNRLSDVPELVFINLHMEELNGFDFLAEFSQLSDFVRSKCKIVVLTNLNDTDEKFRVLSDPGVVRYLIKPLDAFQLREFINR